MLPNSERHEGISVVIAAYNGADTIAQTLASCLDQSVPPAEIVVVDDASTDRTADIVRHFDSGTVPIRLLTSRSNSVGPARPFNRGILAAACETVALLEQDDIWHRDKLLWSRKAFELFPEAGMVYADHLAFEGLAPDRTAAPAGVVPDIRKMTDVEAVNAALERQFTLTISNMVVRKDAWKRAGGFAESFRISADYAFLMRLLASGCGVAHVPLTLVYYRVHPHSVWLNSDYFLRHREKYRILDFLIRLAKGSDAASARSRRLGPEIFDTGFLAAKSGRVREAMLFYFWSLKHGQPPGRVLRSAARAAAALLGKKYA